MTTTNRINRSTRALALNGALALTILVFASTAAQATEPVYYAFERKIAATGQDAAEATLVLGASAKRVTDRVEAELKDRKYRLLLTQIADVRRLNGPRHRLGCSVRFLVVTFGGSTHPFFKNAATFGVTSPTVVTLWANGSPSSREVRLSMEEVHRLVSYRGLRAKTLRRLLMQHAWRQLLGSEPDDLEPLAAEASVRVPYRGKQWEFALDTELLNAILGRNADPARLYPITEAEVQAFESAFDLMVDPNTDPEIRKDMRNLRKVSLPLKTDLAKIAFRSLLDLGPAKPRGKPSRGLVSLVGPGD